MPVKKVLLCIIFLSQLSLLYSQDFFDEDEIAEMPSSFYQTNKKVSVLVLACYSDYSFGGSVFLHSNKYLLSNYFEASFRPYTSYIVTAKSESGALVKEMQVGYYGSYLATGIALSVKSDLLFFAKYGVACKVSNTGKVLDKVAYADSHEQTLIFKPPHSGLELFYGIGFLYVLPSGASAQAGYSFVKKTLDIGIGFTF